jgi:HEAT repeat protein
MELIKTYFSKKIGILAILLFAAAAAFMGSYQTWVINPKIDKFFYAQPAERERISADLKSLAPFNIRPLKKIIAYADSSTFSEGVKVLQQVEPSMLKLPNAISVSTIWQIPFASKIKNSHDIKILIELLDNPNYSLRENAALALGEIGDTVALTPLCKSLDRTYETQNYRIIEALAQIGDQRAIGPLVSKYEKFKNISFDADNRKIIISIVKALGDLNDTSIAEEILKSAKEKDPEILQAAAIVVAKAGKKLDLSKLLDELYYTYETIPDDLVAPLSAIDKKPASDYFKELSAIRVGKSFNNKTKKAFVISSQMAANPGDKEIAGLLVKFVAHYEKKIAIHAIKALGEIGDPVAVNSLAKLVGHRNDEINIAAMRALSNIGDTTVVGLINQQFISGKENVKLASIDALAMLGGTKAVKSLENILESNDSKHVIAAVHALGKAGNKNATIPLIKKLNDSDYSIVESCLLALGEIGDPASIESINDVLKNSGSTRITRTAAITLGKLGDARAFPECKKLLVMANNPFQHEAANSLMSIKGENISAELTPLLRKNKMEHETKTLVAKVINETKERSSLN